MGEIIPFKRPKAPRKPNKTLCRSGFHRWEVDKERPFEVREGRLLSRYYCSRCGATRTEAR